MSKGTLGPSSVQAEPPLAPDSIPVTRFAGAVRRNLAALVIAVLLGGALGAAKVVLTPATYTSRISVLAPPVALHPGIDIGSALTLNPRNPRETTMDTEAQLVWSEKVLSELARHPGFDAPHDELRDRIGLTVPTGTHVLTIAVRAATPATARRGAEIVADAYLTLRRQVLGQVQQRNREALEENLVLLKTQLRALPGNADELRRLTTRTRRQAIVKQIREVERKIAASKSKEEQPGEVLRAASLPQVRDDRGRDVAGASGVGVGLLAWVAYVLVREMRPRRIRRPADVRLHARLPIMVEAPTLGGGHREVCRRLRNLVFDAEATTVLVAGVPPEAGTALAYELAELCTEGGSATTVLRIAADGERPGEPPRAAHARRAFAVRLVRSDDDRQLTRAVDRAGRESRIVIITTPDINGADTIAAAAASDLTLVVAERGRALDREVASGVLALDQSANPARVIVLTAPAPGGPAPAPPRRRADRPPPPARTPARATAPGRG